MGWLSSAVTGVKAVSNGLINSSKWIWNGGYLSTLFNYAANTLFYGVDQILAVRRATTTLIYHDDTKKIAKSMVELMIYDVSPMVGLNGVNQVLQYYGRQSFGSNVYGLATLTLIDYGVSAITWRQGTQATFRMLVLASLGPGAFNSHKKTSPYSLCEEYDCNWKRMLKSAGIEPFILAANDTLTAAISYTPYGGYYLSHAIKIGFRGRYIARMVTPERCEEHKAMMQESVWALGLGYEASLFLMNRALEATVGIPPFLYHRILEQLVLLLHINLAAHMRIPLIKPTDPLVLKSIKPENLVKYEDATFKYDPLMIYERVCRSFANVIYKGAKAEFGPQEDTEPLIPLSTILEFFTQLLNKDLEAKRKLMLALSKPVETSIADKPESISVFSESADQSLKNETKIISIFSKLADKKVEEKPKNSLFYNEKSKKIITIAIPPIFHGIDGLLNDFIVVKYWPTMQKGSLFVIDKIIVHGQSSAVGWAALFPKTSASLIKYKTGIPVGITEFLLELSDDPGFWSFLTALQQWFERHGVAEDIKFAELTAENLPTDLGKTKGVVLPSTEKNPVSIPTAVLFSPQTISGASMSKEDLKLSTKTNDSKKLMVIEESKPETGAKKMESSLQIKPQSNAKNSSAQQGGFFTTVQQRKPIVSAEEVLQFQ